MILNPYCECFCSIPNYKERNKYQNSFKFKALSKSFNVHFNFMSYVYHNKKLCIKHKNEISKSIVDYLQPKHHLSEEIKEYYKNRDLDLSKLNGYKIFYNNIKLYKTGVCSIKLIDKLKACDYFGHTIFVFDKSTTCYSYFLLNSHNVHNITFDPTILQKIDDLYLTLYDDYEKYHKLLIY